MSRRIRRKVTEDQATPPRVRYAPTTQHQLDIVEEAKHALPGIEIGMTPEQVREAIDRIVWKGRHPTK